MRILIKLGGTLLDTPEVRDRLACEIAGLAASGTGKWWSSTAAVGR